MINELIIKLGVNVDDDDVMDMQEVVSVGSSPSKRGRAASVQSKSASPTKRAKRVVKCMSPSACDNINVEGLNAMREVNKKLKKFLFIESNKMSKPACEFVLKCMSECEG